MMKKKMKKVFNPDYRVAPGEILQEIIEVRNISLDRLSSDSGLSIKYLEEVLAGTCTLTEEAAEGLERVVEATKATWLAIDKDYKSFCGRIKY